MSRRRAAGVVGALAGAVALGAAVGLTAERYAVGRVRLAPDPQKDEHFFALPADRVRTVVADDGVPLHVEEVGPREAPVTVVFCHGYTLSLACWHFQRKAFAVENPGKLVFWDQRSHGRSGRSAAQHATIDQLGRDLYRVIEECAPRGKIVLVGHSMGGMTVMALADQHPELFDERVVGVALLSTSTGKLGEITLGLPAVLGGVTSRVAPFVVRNMHARPHVFERGRRVGTDLAYLATRAVSFGQTDVAPSLVAFMEQMIADVPVDVIAQFYDALVNHDKLAALPTLANTETLVLVGTHDVLTPVSHSRTIAAALPDAQLVVVEGAGHLVQLERDALVTLHLRALVRRSLSARRRSA